MVEVLHVYRVISKIVENFLLSDCASLFEFTFFFFIFSLLQCIYFNWNLLLVALICDSSYDGGSMYLGVFLFV